MPKDVVIPILLSPSTSCEVGSLTITQDIHDALVAAFQKKDSHVRIIGGTYETRSTKPRILSVAFLEFRKERSLDEYTEQELLEELLLRQK